jgi:hypothetical protein
MPLEQVPFSMGQASGLEQLAGAMPLAANVLVEVTNTVRSRPGITAWTDFPTVLPNASPVVGMAPFGEYLVYATEDRKLFAWSSPGLVLSLSDATAATKLDGAERAQFLALRDKVVAVGGGVPQKWTSGLSARLGGSPPAASTVLGLTTRIVVAKADRSGQIQWSGLGDGGHETWDALNFAEAEGKPDPLLAIADATNEVFAFGTQTVQVFAPDAVAGFSPIRTATVGLLAPYSVIRVDDRFAFFDSKRRFVLTDARGFAAENVMSVPIESKLRELTTVADCWGFRLNLAPFDACVWFFPTEGKGFIWEMRGNKWSEWRSWSPNGWIVPSITSMVEWPEKNLFLVGLNTGQIARLDLAAATDLANQIRTEIVTGFVDRGTQNFKHCQAVRFKFKRGGAAFGTAAPQVFVSYRDDLGPFIRQATRDLGTAGDYNPVVEVRSAGRYRQRQWKLAYTGGVALAFVGAEESFEVLAN